MMGKRNRQKTNSISISPIVLHQLLASLVPKNFLRHSSLLDQCSYMRMMKIVMINNDAMDSDRTRWGDKYVTNIVLASKVPMNKLSVVPWRWLARSIA